MLYFEETRVAYLRAIGHPFTEWREAGLEAPVLEAFVRYRQPLRFDEVMTVHVRLAHVSRATFQMAYLVTVDDDARATEVTVHGCSRLDGRPTRLPPITRHGQPPYPIRRLAPIADISPPYLPPANRV